VRNEDDGSVVLEVQGEGTAVAEFLASLSQTLGRFIVNEVRTPVPCSDGEVGFLIRN
jgi:hypothetical protein